MGKQSIVTVVVVSGLRLGRNGNWVLDCVYFVTKVYETVENNF